jgi:hypothetical protein
VLPLSVKLHALQAAEEARAVGVVSRLDSCDGFAVYDRDGRVGTVVQACPLTLPSAHEPAPLCMRTGLFHRRVVLIAPTAVEQVYFRQGRITLKARWSDAHIGQMPGEVVTSGRRAALA